MKITQKEYRSKKVIVGAVLSQCSSWTIRCIPVRFFSHRLSPTECNYDIGNRELMAVKLALEEWCHLLEGAGVPFIVWTDHKNLEYIRSAKRLNSGQARWALYFGRFDFPFPTARVPRTSNLMLYLLFLIDPSARRLLSLSYHRRSWALWKLGRSNHKVWLSSRNIPLRTVCNNLAPEFIGPFTLTKIISPVAVRLKLPPAYRRVHSVFHVSKLRPVFHSTLNPLAVVPPPPRLLDGEPTYSVNRILNSRRRGRGFQYLVDCWWKVTVQRRGVGFLRGTYWISP